MKWRRNGDRDSEKKCRLIRRQFLSFDIPLIDTLSLNEKKGDMSLVAVLPHSGDHVKSKENREFHCHLFCNFKSIQPKHFLIKLIYVEICRPFIVKGA